MDVKSGSGAFMKSAEDSEALARSLIRTAKDMGRQVVCVLSDMGQPLGRAVGNSIEVIESVECLQGKGPGDVMELVYELGARMLTAGQAAGTVQDAREILREKISSGEAFERFVRLIDEQGGDPVFAEDTVRFPRASHNRPVKSEISGTVTSIDAQAIGTASVLLGAGRAKMEDTIDHSAGITVHGKIGDRVKPGDRLLTLHYNSDRHAREAYTMALGAYSIHDKPAPEFRLIHRVLL
jgi:pyrimidine-nucleoside phosphorylase